MNAAKMFSRRNLLQWRHFSRSSVLCEIIIPKVGSATPIEPVAIPMPDAEKVFSPKLEKIALDISTLNLIEVSELSQLLKKKLNLPDAPMMPMGGFSMQAAAKDEEVAAPKQIQTEFTVKLTEFDDKQKVALIKEIKNTLQGYNLVQAKKFVESLPAIVKTEVSKEEADKLKEVFTKVGAVIEIV